MSDTIKISNKIIKGKNIHPKILLKSESNCKLFHSDNEENGTEGYQSDSAKWRVFKLRSFITENGCIKSGLR